MTIFNAKNKWSKTKPLKTERRAKPRVIFYKMECQICQQIFGVHWERQLLGMWSVHPPAPRELSCSLCGSLHTKSKMISEADYRALNSIWDLDDLQLDVSEGDKSG